MRINLYPRSLCLPKSLMKSTIEVAKLWLFSLLEQFFNACTYHATNYHFLYSSISPASYLWFTKAMRINFAISCPTMSTYEKYSMIKSWWTMSIFNLEPNLRSVQTNRSNTPRYEIKSYKSYSFWQFWVFLSFDIRATFSRTRPLIGLNSTPKAPKTAI